MTTPGLSQIAVWDIPLLRGAVVTLAAIHGRLSAWCTRVDGTGRELQSGESWSGPAGRSSCAAVLELSRTSGVVVRGLGESLAACERLLAEAAIAQELAVDARAVAASAGLILGETGEPAEPLATLLPTATPAEAAALAVQAAAAAHAGALAAEALGHAAAASAAAAAAAEAMADLGVVGAVAPATFDDLAARFEVMGPVTVPTVPAGRAPHEAAAWWESLSAAERRNAVRFATEEVGMLDGIPAAARDQANRLLLDRALEDRSSLPDATARAVAAEMAALEAEGQQVQLHTLDLDADLVGFAIGDLDTADAVGVLVPGTGNTAEEDLDGLVEDAEGVADAARAAAPGLDVAALAWMAYRTPPDLVEAGKDHYARAGGPKLDRALDGMAATRAVSGTPAARTTVIAHSYATVVVDAAADAPGELAADRVVLLGSPGMDDTAASLEVPEVYDALGGDDDLIRTVAWSGWHGTPTEWTGYGSTGLPVQDETGHSDYYDPDHPTLAAIGEVVAGAADPG